MDRETLDKAVAIMAKEKEAIFGSDNPKQAALDYLIRVGQLNADGSIPERFGGRVRDSQKPATNRLHRIKI